MIAFLVFTCSAIKTPLVSEYSLGSRFGGAGAGGRLGPAPAAAGARRGRGGGHRVEGASGTGNKISFGFLDSKNRKFDFCTFLVLCSQNCKFL